MLALQFAGTTVKGAVDDLDLVIQTLEECGFNHDRFYIHCDGALFGLMMPFVKLVCHLISTLVVDRNPFLKCHDQFSSLGSVIWDLVLRFFPVRLYLHETYRI